MMENVQQHRYEINVWDLLYCCLLIAVVIPDHVTARGCFPHPTGRTAHQMLHMVQKLVSVTVTTVAVVSPLCCGDVSQFVRLSIYDKVEKCAFVATHTLTRVWFDQDCRSLVPVRWLKLSFIKLFYPTRSYMPRLFWHDPFSARLDRDVNNVAGTFSS